MTAHDLIDDIFSRPQRGAPNLRRITPDQLKYLRILIGRDPEGGAVRQGNLGSMIWSPMGRHNYVITEDPTGGGKHTLVKLTNAAPKEQGSLF